MSTSELKTIVTELYDKGLNLNEILDHLLSEKEIDITFMDLRLIISEIEDSRNMYDPSLEHEVEEEEEIPEEVEEEECTIELNSILQPGAPMQGVAKFKSGKKLKFMLDQQGRVGIEPIDSAEPDQDEIKYFQEALMEKARSGML